ERVPPAAGRPTPASRPVQPGTGPGRPSRPVPEPRRRPEDRPQVDERNGSALPERRAPEVPQRDAAQRGPLDPTQRGPLDATQRGASDPSSPSSVPPLPRRRRGEVPPPLPQSFVRPPAVPGDAEALPGTQASRPGESGTGRAR